MTADNVAVMPDLFEKTGDMSCIRLEDDVIEQAIKLVPDEEGRKTFNHMARQVLELWDEHQIIQSMHLPEAVENSDGMTSPVLPEASKTCDVIRERVKKGIPVPVVVSSLLLSTALFKPGSRRKNFYIRNKQLLKTDMVEINYDGPEMAQGELDVLMVLNSIMANTRKPVVELTAYQLTATLGMGHGSHAQEELEQRLKNLSSSQLDIRVKTDEVDEKGKPIWNRYVGNLIFSWSRTGKRGLMKIAVNPLVPMLMRDTSLTLLDLKTRLSLRRNSLAKWLYTYAREMTIFDENGNIVPRIKVEQWRKLFDEDETDEQRQSDEHNVKIPFERLVYRLTVDDLVREFMPPPKQDGRKKSNSAKYYVYDLKKRLEKAVEKLNNDVKTEFLFEFDKENGIIISTLKD